MAHETSKTSVTVGNKSIPGILRDRQYIAEAPVNTYILYRSLNLPANAERLIEIQADCRLEHGFFVDASADNTYIFTITPPKSPPYVSTYSGSNVSGFGSLKTIEWKGFPLQKGAMLRIKVVNAITELQLICQLAYVTQTINF